MANNPRKICVVIFNRASYARIKSVLLAIQETPGLELQIILGGAALLGSFGDLSPILQRDGFEVKAHMHIILEGSTLVTMPKSTGLAIIELTSLMENLKPDIVLSIADRFETIAAAIVGSYMNIPVAHVQGGEVSGSIDENVRHAVSKLSHIHFPATDQAYERLLRMGEQPERIYKTGCPSLDLLLEEPLDPKREFFAKIVDSDKSFRPDKPYIVVINHPVTTEYNCIDEQIRKLLEAISQTQIQTFWFCPNVDAGSYFISTQIDLFKERKQADLFHFMRNLPPELFLLLIKNCSCIVGNSSVSLREASFLGIPAVNIGNRQRGRECGENVIHVPYNVQAIRQAVAQQIQHGRYPPSQLFGDGTAGKKIARILSQVDINIEKRFI